MGNPYISPIYPYNTWVFMVYYPQESLYKPYKYHGYTVRGTPNCPLIITIYIYNTIYILVPFRGNRKVKHGGRLYITICAMVKRRVFLGMGDLPPLIGNPYNGYINPYYWVDDHPLLYGDNGSLGPGTYDSSEFGAVIIKLSHCSLHDPSCQPSQRHTPEGHKAQTYQCG